MSKCINGKLIGFSLLLFQSKAYATGIMLPDMGWFANFVLYIGVLLLLVVFCSSLIWIISNWLKKPVTGSSELGNEHMTSRLTMLQNLVVQTIKTSTTTIQNHRVLKWFVVFVIPYLLILIYASNVLKEQNSPFNNYVLFEVLIVYTFIYVLPLIIIKFMLKIRSEARSNDDVGK